MSISFLYDETLRKRIMFMASMHLVFMMFKFFFKISKVKQCYLSARLFTTFYSFNVYVLRKEGVIDMSFISHFATSILNILFLINWLT